jgi:hypothetical protein
MLFLTRNAPWQPRFGFEFRHITVKGWERQLAMWLLKIAAAAQESKRSAARPVFEAAVENEASYFAVEKIPAPASDFPAAGHMSVSLCNCARKAALACAFRNPASALAARHSGENILSS